MPWNRPSSQPTSWAWAIRSSASVGVSELNGRESRSSSSTSSGARPVLELLDRRLVDLGEPGAAGLVERRRLHLLEQLADHAADAHDLGGLLDEVGDVALGVLLGPSSSAAGPPATAIPSGPSTTTRGSVRRWSADAAVGVLVGHGPHLTR